jgi:F0F1-type ATP synthase membrane subunit a
MNRGAVQTMPFDMDEGLPFLGGEVNWVTVANGMAAVAAVSIAAWLLMRRLRKVPGRAQAAAEYIAIAVERALGPISRRWLPLAGTLMLFIAANCVFGLIRWQAFPAAGGAEWMLGGDEYVDYNGNGRYDPGEYFVPSGVTNRYKEGISLPPLYEPAADINTLVGIGAVFFLAGLWPLALRARPMIEAPQRVLVPAARLLAAMAGGAALIGLIEMLLRRIDLPSGPAMMAGLLAGTAQAFLFGALMLVWLAGVEKIAAAAEVPVLRVLDTERSGD